LAKSWPNPGGFGPDELSGGYHLFIGKDLVPMSYHEDIVFSSGMLERYVVPPGHPFFLKGLLASLIYSYPALAGHTEAPRRRE